MSRGTDRAHQLRIVTCKRDREAIAAKVGYEGEASSHDIREWMELALTEAIDEARSDFYAERKEA